MGRPRMFAGRAAAAVAAGCLLIVVAFVFDAASLFVPGIALVLLGAVAPAWVWSTARGARVQRVLTAERVVEEQPLEAAIEVRRGLLGLPGAEVSDPFSGSRFDLAATLAPIRGDREAGVRVLARLHRRGLHRLAPPTLRVSDPLGLARAVIDGPGSTQTLLVLPATQPVRWLAGAGGRRLAVPDGRSGAEALAAVDLDRLRPYRPGTPASRIHWPALARGAGLLERRLQADGDARPLVVLDARLAASGVVGASARGGRDAGPGAAPVGAPLHAGTRGAAPDAGTHGTAALDAAVRAAASLVLELARGGGCGLLLPGEQRPTVIDRELAGWPAAYARLAVVAPAVRAPVLGAALGRSGAMIYIAAAPVARLGATLTAIGAGAVLLVVPDRALVAGRPPGISVPARPALAVSGCRGFLLGAGRAQRQRSREAA